MNLLSYLTAFAQNALYYGPPFVFLLTVVIFFHELGHFLVARWCGVKISTFSIGFGPEIFGFYDRYGTRWRVAWLPFGGYVKFIDDDNVTSVPTANQSSSVDTREGVFHRKPLWQRAAVVAAGPIANFLLAMVLFSGLFYFFGLTQTLARVDAVVPGTVAERAGFKVGDLVVGIDGQPIDSFADMVRIVGTSADKELQFTIDRGGQKVTLAATPERMETKDRFCNTYTSGRIGISRSSRPEDWKTVTFGPLEAIRLGIEETYFITTRTLDFLYGLLIGRESIDQLGGPIKIAEVSGQVASLGFVALLNLTAIMSVSIGLFNLFPIPILDGGNLMFYAIEAIRQRPLSERAQMIGFKIGLALLGMLMIFVMSKDLLEKLRPSVGC